jgi:hypothetical protein
MVDGFQAQPITLDGTITAPGPFSVSTAGELIMPAFIDNMGTALIFPLRALALQGTLSADLSCVGTYNADGLDPANACAPDTNTPAFLPDGTGNAFITLEEADTVTIGALQQSLCVLLSGNATTYGMQMGSLTVCKRDSAAKIVFQGDWCASTNMAANGGCADSVKVRFNFAAGSVHFSP